MKVKFNKEKLEKILKDNKMSKSKVAVVVLDHSVAYLYDCIKRNCMMEKEDLVKIAEYFKVNLEDLQYGIPNDVTIVKHTSTIKSDDMELLVIGLNNQFESQKETNKLLSDILTEIKVTNAKVNRLEEKMHHLENAVGACVGGVMVIKDIAPELKDKLEYIRSNTRLIEGRLKEYFTENDETYKSKLRQIK